MLEKILILVFELLDANQCGTSEVHPPQQDGSFTIKAKPWTPNFEGDIIGVGGHVSHCLIYSNLHTKTNINLAP
jgi:hypothetical protein